ncbi:hypothetical protein RRF57_011386 [Xylaria bambusicola]|uniref:Uncharacterized protein n=1 Tax=Xylaria bambusicola TaxID=326684 RepID=A0AAN7V4J1_9PEZI
MAKEKPPKPEEAEGSSQIHKRKKSTGTINLLVETRRQASDDYARAQRAEKAYRMRKNATIARSALRETKTHFIEGFKHIGQGLKGLFTVIRAVPYLIGEKQEISRRRSEVKKRARAEDMRKKLDEKLARKYAGVEEETEEGEDGEKKSEAEASGGIWGKKK